jgi:hypothetical protein
MKKINDFFNTGAYWKVFLLTSFIIASSAYCFFSFLTMIVLPVFIIVKIALTTGLFIGLVFTLMIKQLRDSKKFWEYAEELEKKLDKANTKEELDVLFDGDYLEMGKLASGSIHMREVNRLYTIIKTKYSFINYILSKR